MSAAKKFVTILFSGLLIIAMVACSKQPSASEANYRRGFETDIPIEVHAADAIQAFQGEYPEMQITKLRWQKEGDGSEIYIVEGIHNRDKNIIKYQMDEQLILDRIERTLSEEEMENGKSVERVLVYDNLLTYTELCDIATGEHAGTVLQFIVKWKGEQPTAYIEVYKDGASLQGFTINVVTGEILH